jgi:hypothetical protein
MQDRSSLLECYRQILHGKPATPTTASQALIQVAAPNRGERADARWPIALAGPRPTPGAPKCAPALDRPPLSLLALAQELYDIEDRARDMTADKRQVSRPRIPSVWHRMREWLDSDATW